MIDYNKIRLFLMNKGINQNELAEKLNWQPYRVSKFLKGKTNPTFSTLENISKALGLSIKEMIKD